MKLAVYFAQAYRSCQRAINENTNGLLRHYLPKKTDFSTLTAVQLKSYVDKLNNRPRKKPGYRTPSEVFHERAVAVRL
ncbi:MAG: IS30 family transposase [Candidatus Competibacteraceae bacterium]|nr:IS30 family transposase [Candidatus Competibacteraceae bacterium]